VQGVFNFAALYYRKLEEIMMDPYQDEGFYRALMTQALEQNWSYLKVLLDDGADALAYGGNMAGGEVGPAFFEQFVLEYETELIRRIHNAGGRIIWHNCGKASSLWDLYPKTGMDCLESLAQPPEGDTDLGEAKSKLGSHMALSGGIDQKTFLLNASAGEVEQKVAEVLEVMKPDGGFILSTVDYLSEDTPIENVQAFVDAGMKYGRY
jgi:uroporphyrinogen decarboxylase